MPATRTKLAQGAESRDKLLNAAAHLVATGGYAGTSVDAIAKRAGVAKSALYWHFGNKNGLLTAALELRSSEWVAEVQGAVGPTTDPLKRLDTLLAQVRELIVERSEARRMVFAVLLERGTHDEVARQAVSEVFQELRKALNKGFAEVLPIPPERLEIITDAIVNLCDGVFMRFLADRDVEHLDRALGEVRRLVMLRLGHEIQKTYRKQRNKKT